MVKRKEMDCVLSSLVEENIGPGPEMRKFCGEVSRMLGVEKGIALRDRERALYVALSVLELEKGKGVIISALSPSYYADVIQSLNLYPVYADVDPDTAAVTPSSVEAVLSEDVQAIIVHYPLGYVPEIEKLVEYGIPVIEDVSQALLTRLEDKAAGSFGAFCLIDVEWNSLITAGGGCLLLPCDKKYRRQCKSLFDSIPEHLLLPDMNASLGLAQVLSLEKRLEERGEIEEIFQNSLMKSRHKTFLQRGEWKNVPFCFPVILQSAMNDVIQYTHKKGILIEPAFGNCVLSSRPDERFPSPNAQAVMLRTVVFPLYPILGKKNIATISKVLATLP
ncbi:MAG: DegT/DnrJ/EryC1/StrS aminotransferase family protein [Spirochaetales bacterium]|nr:DegT/DnrJ/EryC1/StrS aminotransferase family protein [Spirochaetales bacterium]